MSKPTNTNENDGPASDDPVKPDTPLFKRLVLPDNCRVVTVERTGEFFTLVGPPMRRIEPTKD